VHSLDVDDLAGEVGPSLVAAAEVLTEHAEVLGADAATVGTFLGGPSAAPGPVQLALSLSNVSGVDETLVAFADSLAGRALALAGDYEQSLRWFRFAMMGVPDDNAQSGNWADWFPPDDPAARIRLEFVRALYPAYLSPERVLDEIGQLPAQPPTTSDADALAANGEVEHALQVTRAAGRQPRRVVDADRAALRIIRRMRLREEEELGGSSLREASDPAIAFCCGQWRVGMVPTARRHALRCRLS
jgi:hypothetical protein